MLEAVAGQGVDLHLAHLAVSGLPGSGSPAELLDAAGISAPHIAAAARDLVTGKHGQRGDQGGAADG